MAMTAHEWLWRRTSGYDGAQLRPRGATPRPRSGAEAESARLRWRRSSQEELSHVWDQVRQPRGATPLQDAVAAWAQEDLEELLHIQGQEGL